MASQDLFIGRVEELERLRKDVFFVEPGDCGYCYSLIGLNGIGKTALIRHLSEEFFRNQPDKTFYFPTVLEDGVTFWTYWTDLIQRFSEEIDEEYLSKLEIDKEYLSELYKEEPERVHRKAITKIENAYRLANSDWEFVETDAYRAQLIRCLNDLFRHYTTLGIRIILTIDEFDRAQSIFTTGQFFQRLFDLTPKGSSTRLNLSIITISRRKASTIVHHMKDGSNFEDAYPSFVLKGFSDAELEEYFDTYAQLPCGLLSKEVQKQILYLCGRSPGLLMGLRHEFERMDEVKVDIGWLYEEHGQFIKNAYSRMVTLMESTFADRHAQQCPLLEVFVQKFIGPAYADNFEVLLPKLYDYGFVTKGTVESNIFVLSGTHARETDGHAGYDVYEPIAPYFVEYIKHTIIPNDLNNLSRLLIKAEKLIREVIEREMRAAFRDGWEDVINQYAGKKDYYLEALQTTALQNDFSSSSISKLNVISFKEYYYIMRDHWHLFSKYFSAYPDRKALFAAMAMLSESRNDSAHLNLEVYNGESRRKLRETCSSFIACLETAPDTKSDSNVPASLTAVQIEKLVFERPTVTFCCQAIKMPKGNLRGIIKEYGYPAGVAQKKLDAFGFASPPNVGDEFRAVIERWDDNAQMFNLIAPD